VPGGYDPHSGLTGYATTSKKYCLLKDKQSINAGACAHRNSCGSDCSLDGRRDYDLAMRVLLVEDEARIAHFVAKGLREQSYAVDVVSSGEQGLYQAAITPYDLVILDVMIPPPDGFMVCRELRNSGQTMPILMLTARDGVEDRIKGLDRGADDYLTKPFEFGELLARLRALLRRSRTLQPARLVVADLVVDTAAQTVERGGKAIPMTAKEYALVEFLARKAGQVVGRAEISEHVWDEEFDPFSNLIEVYINRVRRKIDAGFAKPLLHTRRGAGYMLSSNGETTAPKQTSVRSHDDV
jgi:DNA-binding response OmpR family regulator